MGRRIPTTAFEITRQLQPTDLARFRLYAERVIKVGVWDSFDYNTFLPNDVRNYVATHDSLRELGRVATANGWRLLPNVTTLACKDEILPVSVSPQIPHLFSPHLREFRYERLDLERGDDNFSMFAIPSAHVKGEEDVITMLAALQSHAPLLVKLDVHIMICSRPIAQTFWDVVLMCRDLVVLDGGQFPITTAALRHVVRLPSLEKLSFVSTDKTFTKQEILAFRRDVSASKTFPKLHVLTMRVINLDLATTVVRRISSPYLLGLEIEVLRSRKPVPSVSVPPFFHSFCGLPNMSAMSWLHVRFDVYCHNSPGTIPDPVTQDMLRPFLASSRMSSFELFVGCPFDLNDALIEDMVRTWPHISILRLGGHYPRGLDYKPEVTLNAIVAMARGWPYLKELSIEFDTDVSQVPAATSKMLRDSNRVNGAKDLRTLDYMDIGFSKIDDEMAVAALLSELFTPLTEISSSWDDLAQQEAVEEELRMGDEGDAFQPDPDLEARAVQYTTYYDRWCCIEDHMLHVDLIRRQERNWRSATTTTTRSVSP